MKNNFKSDLIAGFLVFLIALPLCLGIAKASGFPPIAGIYTAVIGGLVVTFLTNTPLTIKGPAAGLIVIAIGAVEELGNGDLTKGYQLTLGVIVVSGIIQFILGLLKTGKLGDFFPSAVIHGMLAAIGIIIISKQIHITLGVVPDAKSPLSLLAEIPFSLTKINPEVATIGLGSLLILFVHPKLNLKHLKKIPAPLLVLLYALPMSLFFDLSHEHDYDIGSLQFHIDPSQLLVTLPNDILSGITLPDFSQITNPISLKYIMMFALVGSIESILSAKAIDSLDPKQRKSNLNRDLAAVGIGNILAGMIGGLPMISEIVRSSANINNGAKTKMSNFYHGLFLLIFIVLAGSIIQKIPNAALSAMLVFTGIKLASPQEFKKIKLVGYDQLLIFCSTILITLYSDLLIGVASGIIIKTILHAVRSAKFSDLFKLKTETQHTPHGILVKLFGTTSFLNYLQFKKVIESQPTDKNITLDFSEVQFADHSFIENVHHLQNDFSRNGRELRKIGFENHHFQSSHHLASRSKLMNPYLQVQNELMTNRELKMDRIAKYFGYDFEATASPSLVRPYLSPFHILPRFRRAKNFIIGTHKSYNLIFTDIRYENVGDFTRETSDATIAIIHNIAKGGIPDFYTHRDHSIFDLSTKYDFTRNNIKHKTNFSIFGKDEELINSFFTKEISDLISDNNYCIECQRRVFLIHANWQRSSSETEITKFITFVQEFAKKITAQ